MSAPEDSIVPQMRRRLSPLLLLGIILCPVIFAWFLLRRGYSNGLRIAAFAYAGAGLAFAVLQAVSP